MMNSELEGIFNQLKQMGVSLEADQFVNDAGARKVDNARSSCHSVDPEDYFSTIKVPTLCRLCVIHPERGKVVAARGTLFPTNNQGEMIHNNPIAPQNVRVSVDDVITEYQLTPLPVPCYEHETIGNAAGSFVQWPKDLVMLGQDPILEKKKLHEMTPIQKSSKVESKGSVTPLKQNSQVVGDDINSSDHYPVFKNELVKHTHCGTVSKDDKFAFMLPSRLAIPHNHEQQKCKDEATDYMTSLLVANKDKRYILAPYIQEAFKLYVPQDGMKNNRKELIWHHTEVQCPQQKRGRECGFFVMRYMYDIVMLSQKNANMNWKVSLGSRSYGRKEISEI
ncbi:hypothetical protein AgCh_028265 [Apium graveolens]